MFVLASSSPRRRELLHNAGIVFSVDAAEIDETRQPYEQPLAYAVRLARTKAETVLERHPDALVLGADTIVVLDNDVLGKPLDVQDAQSILKRLRGRTHEVITAVALAGRSGTREHQERTQVVFGKMNDAEIEAYAATGEPMDKAGAYAIQGHASKWIQRIEGDYFNVVGLPVAAVWRMLQAAAKK